MGKEKEQRCTVVEDEETDNVVRERTEVRQRHKRWDGIVEANIVRGPMERATEEVEWAIQHLKLGKPEVLRMLQ